MRRIRGRFGRSRRVTFDRDCGYCQCPLNGHARFVIDGRATAQVDDSDDICPTIKVQSQRNALTEMPSGYSEVRI